MARFKEQINLHKEYFSLSVSIFNKRGQGRQNKIKVEVRYKL